MTSPRQVAFQVLRDLDRRDTYPDLALDRALQKTALSPPDRGLATELVYGVLRRQRTLDALISQFSQRPSDQQPPALRRLLQLGLYQLRYLDQVPSSAAVNTSVDLAKENGLGGLSKVVNGILRAYLRQTEGGQDPLILPEEPARRLGVEESFPDWIVDLFLKQGGCDRARELCQAFNQTPPLDLRINPLKTSREALHAQFAEAGIESHPLPGLPQALRLPGRGSIRQLPGFQEGLWTVQSAPAQWVGHCLDPQPGEKIGDACAAPGGKTTHLAELMGDHGQIVALDPTPSRLEKLRQTQRRLGLTSIDPEIADARTFTPPVPLDGVLVDVPCSGLGTLHRNPDLRWRPIPSQLPELLALQSALLAQAATWVKPGGVLVYATCTLNPKENQEQIQAFLNAHPQWSLIPLTAPDSETVEETLTCYPDAWWGDGFFIAKLRRS